MRLAGVGMKKTALIAVFFASCKVKFHFLKLKNRRFNPKVQRK
jgi:hypothetical protein